MISDQHQGRESATIAAGRKIVEKLIPAVHSAVHTTCRLPPVVVSQGPFREPGGKDS